MSLENNNQHNVTAHRIGRLMRRFRQLAHIHAHFESVLREGKRELSGMELWRAQQVAGELGSMAAVLREYRTELPDVPGVLEVK